MNSAHRSRGLAVAALAVAALLASCASQSQSAAERAAEAEAARVAAEIAARTPPPITLNQDVVEAASVYVSFTREMAAQHGGFADAEAVQAALRRGSAYEPAQLSRGLIAYASIVALQSPEFVSGVRRYAVDRATREQLAANIASDPRWASRLPGADAAAGLIMAALGQDIEALSGAATAIENDAYAIQADARRSWAVAPVVNRDGRLTDAKTRSLQAMSPSAPDAARLNAAAHAGTGLPLPAGRPRQPDYPPVVERALALAALAALGEAGETARPVTSALQSDPVSQACLAESKLMLFQCLAASRPSYEDVFCVGRHVVRDIATCVRGASLPAPTVRVSGVQVVEEPRISPAPNGLAAPAPTPVTPVAPAPTAAPTPSPTQRLNSGPNSSLR